MAALCRDHWRMDRNRSRRVELVEVPHTDRQSDHHEVVVRSHQEVLHDGTLVVVDRHIDRHGDLDSSREVGCDGDTRPHDVVECILVLEDHGDHSRHEGGSLKEVVHHSVQVHGSHLESENVHNAHEEGVVDLVVEPHFES